MSAEVDSAIQRLLDAGVSVPAPHLIHVGPDVVLENIEPGVTLLPGCRLEGARTLIRPGTILGAAGPCRVRDCAIGRSVTLQSGSFEDAVFLDGASFGPGAHVRGGTLLEEGASAAHAVGLKQALLLPFAALGSNVNFCDALLSGGSGAKDHSEAGSGFIHFNFTPFGREGDKATPSLFGDVARGVWLRSPRVFLGGAGGVVGPIRVGFGTILAAGSVYRRDRGEGLLVLGERLPGEVLERDLRVQKGAARKVAKNVSYMAQVAALSAFYRHVRRPLARERPGRGLVDSALALLDGALRERVKQLRRYVRGLEDSARVLAESLGEDHPEVRLQRALPERLEQATGRLLDAAAASGGIEAEAWEQLLAGGDASEGHIAWVRSLDEAAVVRGTGLLERVRATYEGADSGGLLA